MKYYSEVTKKFYESAEDCIKAEDKIHRDIEAAEAEKRKATELRRQRAAEVEQARSELLSARKKYNEVLTKFCNDYGAYHCSIKDPTPETIGEYLDTFINLFN